MNQEISSIGALILAGGQNRRMNGWHKALLPLCGRTLLEHLAAVFSGFDEKLIATDMPELAKLAGFTQITDEIPGLGPLGGLSAALTACRSKALVVCACDMPLVTKEFASYLAGLASVYPDARAIVIKDRSGRVHPLCGLYQKSASPVLLTALKQEEYRVMNVLQKLKGEIIALEDTEFPDSVLTNINTLGEWEQFISPDK